MDLFNSEVEMFSKIRIFEGAGSWTIPCTREALGMGETFWLASAEAGTRRPTGQVYGTRRFEDGLI